jgi:hypothetical protein
MVTEYKVGIWTIVDRKIAYDELFAYYLRFMFSEKYGDTELLFVKHRKGEERFDTGIQKVIHTINDEPIVVDIRKQLKEYDKEKGLENIFDDKVSIDKLVSSCVEEMEVELDFETRLYHNCLDSTNGTLSDEILIKPKQYYFNRWLLCVPALLEAYKDIAPKYVDMFIRHIMRENDEMESV